MRELPKFKLDLKDPENFGNLAEDMDQAARRTFASDLIELIGIDETSMNDWSKEAEGYLNKAEKKGDVHPQDREQDGADDEANPATEMTLAAVIQFSARATGALLGEPDLAMSSEPGGEGLASWVSSQLRTKDPNWTLDTDPLVVHMGVTGLGWRKRDFDADERVFHTRFIPSCGDTKVIINSNVRSVERAPRITEEFERYPYEIERSISRKKWIDYDPVFDEADPQAPKKFYECDAWLDLDDDGIDEPWTVTISRDDHAEVVRIRPRWSKKTVIDTPDELYFNPIRRFYPYRMLPNPKGGFFPIGFGYLLDRIENSADSLLGSITDTAKSEAENGGILAGGGYGLPDKIELKGNRVTTLNTDGAPLANRWSPFPVKSVSQGSVSTLTQLMTLGDRLAGTMNLMENAPASMTATMAKGIIDTGSQVQSAVHRRLVASMTQEFRMFVAMADAYDMLPDGISASDGGGIAVTADPQLATEMQRSALGGLYLQMIELGSKAPSFNVQEAVTRFAKVMRLPDPEKLVAAPQQPQATPDEKMKGALGLMKHQNEKIKVTAAAAVQLTQALKNMVEASGGMLDNRQALLQMAQLENAVQQMMQDAGSAGDAGNSGMAGQPGNQGPPGGAAPAQGGNPPDLSGGAPGGLGGPGAGNGAA